MTKIPPQAPGFSHGVKESESRGEMEMETLKTPWL